MNMPVFGAKTQPMAIAPMHFTCAKINSIHFLVRLIARLVFLCAALKIDCCFTYGIYPVKNTKLGYPQK
jgi:hypothetical protein